MGSSIVSYQIELLVEPENVHEILISLIDIDDIDIQLLEERRTTPADQQKQHPQYSLAPNDLATILIAVPAIITSITKLVKVILDYKLKTAQQKNVRKKAAHDKEPSIVVEGEAVPLSKFSTEKDLQVFLEEKLN